MPRSTVGASRSAKATKNTPPPTSVILLVRHGTTPTTGKILPGRAPGLHLSEVGHAQAQAVADRIGALTKKPTAIYSSPLERTRETAQPIAKAIGQRVKLDKGLWECDFGDWTGAELAKLYKRTEWSTVQRWPGGFRFPGGESFAELQTRAQDALLKLAAAHRGETVVAVSHADVIKAAVAAVAGIPLDLFQRIVIAPCSVTAVAFGPGGPSVLCVNSTSTLSELAVG